MKTATAPLPPTCVRSRFWTSCVSAYATCITAYQPNGHVHWVRVPSSVSTVCVTRQPWAAAKSRHFCPGWRTAQGFGLHASSGIGGLAVLLRQGAVHGSALASGDRKTSAVAALAVVLTPDEVVRILGFLEGEHRLFASFCMERACGSVGFATAGQGSGFDHGTIIVRRARAQGSGLDVTRGSLAPSLREQLSRARAWWLKDQAEGRSGVALPDMSGSIRAPGIPGRGSGFLRTRIRPIHGAVSCVAITCMTRPFSAPSNVP